MDRPTHTHLQQQTHSHLLLQSRTLLITTAAAAFCSFCFPFCTFFYTYVHTYMNVDGQEIYCASLYLAVFKCILSLKKRETTIKMKRFDNNIIIPFSLTHSLSQRSIDDTKELLLVPLTTFRAHTHIHTCVFSASRREKRWRSSSTGSFLRPSLTHFCKCLLHRRHQNWLKCYFFPRRRRC